MCASDLDYSASIDCDIAGEQNSDRRVHDECRAGGHVDVLKQDNANGTCDRR